MFSEFTVLIPRLGLQRTDPITNPRAAGTSRQGLLLFSARTPASYIYVLNKSLSNDGTVRKGMLERVLKNG